MVRMEPSSVLTVGDAGMIDCTVSTVSGVELDSVMISWMGPRGNITNDSRVTISRTTSSGNNYISSLEFEYLAEGDEGNYTCNVMILDVSESESLVLSSMNLTGKSTFYNVYVVQNSSFFTRPPFIYRLGLK